MKQWLSGFLIFWIIGFTGFAQTASAYSWSMSKEDIQAKLDKKFPIRRDKGFFWVELRNPQPNLNSESNELGLSVDLHYQLLDKNTKTGKIHLLGKPTYDPVAGEFYLADVKIVQFDLEGARADQAYLLRKQLAKVAKKKLKRVKLYRLKANLRDQLVKAFIQRVRVDDDKVVVELGFGE